MKTVRGTLIAADQITPRIVDVTLRLQWSPGTFDLQTGATYLVAFESHYKPVPEIPEPSAVEGA